MTAFMGGPQTAASREYVAKCYALISASAMKLRRTSACWRTQAGLVKVALMQ